MYTYFIAVKKLFCIIETLYYINIIRTNKRIFQQLNMKLLICFNKKKKKSFLGDSDNYSFFLVFSRV